MKKLNHVEFWDLISPIENPHWPVICVDFNGVLDTHKGWNGSVEWTPPAEGVEDFLKKLREKFNTIIVFTATQPLDGVMVWFNEYKLDHLVDYVSGYKVPAVVYVDDRAITHTGNFEDTLSKIENFREWWRD